MIGDRVQHGNEAWELLLTLLDIIEFLFKSNYKKKELETLRSLVQKHRTIYDKLFGKLKPKHHFMVHYATPIEKYGCLRYLWCMRFEAKHKDSKIYFHNVNSRFNPPHILAIKCQIKFAKFLTDHAKSIEPYLRLTSKEQSILNYNLALEINKNHGSVNNF